MIPEAQIFGLAGLVGSSSVVGVVGYTMGGGFGWLVRGRTYRSSKKVFSEVAPSSKPCYIGRERYGGERGERRNKPMPFADSEGIPICYDDRGEGERLEGVSQFPTLEVPEETATACPHTNWLGGNGLE